MPRPGIPTTLPARSRLCSACLVTPRSSATALVDQRSPMAASHMILATAVSAPSAPRSSNSCSPRPSKVKCSEGRSASSRCRNPSTKRASASALEPTVRLQKPRVNPASPVARRRRHDRFGRAERHVHTPSRSCARGSPPEAGSEWAEAECLRDALQGRVKSTRVVYDDHHTNLGRCS